MKLKKTLKNDNGAWGSILHLIEVPQVLNERLTTPLEYHARRNEESGNEITPSVDTDRVNKLVTRHHSKLETEAQVDFFLFKATLSKQKTARIKGKILP